MCTNIKNPVDRWINIWYTVRNPTIYRKELTVLKKSNAKTYIIILMATLLLGIAGAAFLFYAMNFDYAADIQHFKPSTALSIAVLLGVVTVVISAAAYFITGKYTVFKKSNSYSFVPTFFSVITACFCVYYGYMTFKNGLIPQKEVLSVMQILFSFLSALWFLLDALGIPKKSPSVNLLSYSPALLFSFIASQIYFDPINAMNGSIKNCCLIMCAAFAIAYVEMCGVIYDAPHAARKAVAGFVLSTGVGGAISISLLATFIINSQGYNYTVLSAATFVVLWLMSVIIFGNLVTSAEICIPATEENSDNKEDSESSETDEKNDDGGGSTDTSTNNESSKKASDKILNAPQLQNKTDTKAAVTEKQAFAKKHPSSDAFTMFNSNKIDPEDRDEFYFEDNEDEDIHIPPMEFDDGEE